ncbi:MAG: hypothetical protein J3Q66DRAFT_364572 [Benniella sp.]|nr:MAG: hypothetical protein J3Q66DRAFT_364572 [Benniella sp.]
MVLAFKVVMVPFVILPLGTVALSIVPRTPRVSGQHAQSSAWVTLQRPCGDRLHGIPAEGLRSGCKLYFDRKSQNTHRVRHPILLDVSRPLSRKSPYAVVMEAVKAFKTSTANTGT